MSSGSDAADLSGPVRPTASADVVHRPLSGPGARLTDGQLHDWQQLSSDVSLPLAVTQMEAAGNIGNLRLVVSGGDPADYRGPVFMDSDIYKTLEAISWELGRAAGGSSDATLATFAAQASELLEQAQAPDGYLNSYVQVTGKPRWDRMQYSHELYCAGHLIQAAIAARRATAAIAARKDAETAPSVAADFSAAAERLFGVARRFADHLVEVFADSSMNDGHPIIEYALAELYRETGHEPYLVLAGHFIDQRGHGLIGDSGFGSRYLLDHLPVRESPTEVGHVVRALYLEAGVADVAAETSDRDLLATSLRRWDDMVATKTALTGGNGSRHSGEAFGDAFELPPDRAYNETCAAIASFHWSWRLLLATGEARYATLMERLLYNGFGAGVSAEGNRFFYVNPLQRRIDHFENDHNGRRREWFSCACCPPNVMRTRASLQHYLATVAGDTLYLHQFTGSEIAADLPAGHVELEVSTTYPWSGRVEIGVRQAPEAECGIAVRVPDWSAQASLSLGGEALDAGPDERGYLTVTRRWQPGDVLTLDLDISPRLTYPSRHADALRGTVAVQRGPLVYCFEQADQGEASVEDLAVVPGGLAEQDAPAGLSKTTVAVTVPAALLPSASAELYPARPDGTDPGRPATAVAIPYFQWDNRDGGPMRIWMPLAQPAGAAASNDTAAPAAASADDGNDAASGDPAHDRVPRPRQIP